MTDEVDAGLDALGELATAMTCDAREQCPASDLVLGHKCGGSDGLSGITANPVVGRVADRLTALGGRVILTEVPEMFGAEHLSVDVVHGRDDEQQGAHRPTVAEPRGPHNVTPSFQMAISR